jgi:hypothetical protein
MSVKCEQNSSYPVLANADTGAGSVMISPGPRLLATEHPKAHIV